MSVVNRSTLRHFSFGVVALSLAACGSSEDPSVITASSAGYFETAVQADPQAEAIPAEASADHNDSARAEKLSPVADPIPGYARVQYGSDIGRPELFNLSHSIWVRTRGTQMSYELSWRWNEFRTGRLWLESDAVKEDGSIGDIATFGVYGANGSSGPNCGPVDGNPSIQSCTIPTTITNWSNHRLFVWRLDADDQGQWWGAWLVNRGRAHWIGRIRTPGNSAFIRTTPTVTAEYQGGRFECDDVPRSSVIFYNTVGNRTSSFNSEYVFRVQDVLGANCPGERARTLRDSRMLFLDQGMTASSGPVSQ